MAALKQRLSYARLWQLLRCAACSVCVVFAHGDLEGRGSCIAVFGGSTHYVNHTYYLTVKPASCWVSLQKQAVTTYVGAACVWLVPLCVFSTLCLLFWLGCVCDLQLFAPRKAGQLACIGLWLACTSDSPPEIPACVLPLSSNGVRHV
jgi:hypothetical protein